MKQVKSFFIGMFFLCFLPASFATAQSGTKVDIITNKGTITVLLYDETPGHRDNFIKLVKENFYNNMLYHRIIKDFIIQIGDPRSRTEAGKAEEYYKPETSTIPAEINPKFFHRRGVLNAARNGEAQNPYLESSTTHFTIIQGRVQTDESLEGAQNRSEGYYRAHLTAKYSLELKKSNPDLAKEENEEKLKAAVAQKVEEEMQKIKPSIQISPERREVYKTVGGSPHLDNTYTVFGEVLSGMEVVDAIANVPTDRERPTEEVYIIRMELK